MIPKSNLNLHPKSQKRFKSLNLDRVIKIINMEVRKKTYMEAILTEITKPPPPPPAPASDQDVEQARSEREFLKLSLQSKIPMLPQIKMSSKQEVNGSF
jgi:hypothetical protein